VRALVLWAVVGVALAVLLAACGDAESSAPASDTPEPASVAPAPLPAPAAAVSRSRFSREYDGLIEAAAGRFLPDAPWMLYKGQLYQESLLNPDARSPAGAEGIAQFMPGTAADIFPLLGYGALDRRLAGPAIEAGAYYMARLRRGWSSPRPWGDRYRLALASYNAGFGNILKAQKACGGPALYEPIMACLPQITGRHAQETLGYAPRIYRWWEQMEAGL